MKQGTRYAQLISPLFTLTHAQTNVNFYLNLSHRSAVIIYTQCQNRQRETDHRSAPLSGIREYYFSTTYQRQRLILKISN